MKYSVFLEDTDPDSGRLSQKIKMCSCEDVFRARQVASALNIADEEPNREYVVRHEIEENQASVTRKNLIVCAELHDSREIETAWKLMKELKASGVQAIFCFSEVEFKWIFEAGISKETGQLMSIAVGSAREWNPPIISHEVESLEELSLDWILSKLA